MYVLLLMLISAIGFSHQLATIYLYYFKTTLTSVECLCILVGLGEHLEQVFVLLCIDPVNP